MAKGLGYLACAVVVAALLAADAWLLIRTETLSAHAEREIRKAAGDALTFTHVRASLDGGIQLQGVGLQLTQRKLQVLSADKATASLTYRGGQVVVDLVRLDEPRFNFSNRLIEELASAGTGRPLREVISREALPRILCRGGTFEIVHPDVLAWDKPQAFRIDELALVPSTGYRYFIGGRLRSELAGDWRLTGEVDLETGEHNVVLSSDAVTVGPALRAVLSPKVQEAWDHYKPEGPAQVFIHVAYDRLNDKGVEFKATVRPLGMKLQVVQFPLPISGVVGELEFRQDGFTVKRLEASAGPGTAVRFDGGGDGYDSTAGYAFRVEMDRVPIDAALKNALPKNVRKVVDQFSPSGELDGRARVLRDRGPGHHERLPLDLVIRNGSFRYEKFPYDLERADAEISVDGESVRVRSLRAHHRGSEVRISGSIDGIAGDPSIDLQIDATALEFSPALRTACPAEVKKVWAQFEPGGAVDLSMRLRKESKEPEKYRVTVRPRGNNRLVWAEIPLPATVTSGEVTYDEGLLTLNHLKADLDVAGKIEVSAELDLRKGKHFYDYDIKGEGVLIDDRFKRSMPKSLSSLLTTLKISGESTFTLGYREKLVQGKEDREIRLSMYLRRGQFATDVAIEDVDATINLTGSCNEGFWKVAGPLLIHECRIAKKRVSNLQASMTLDGTKLMFHSIRADAYGGQVTGQLRYDIQTDEVTAPEFVVERLDLREFIQDTDKFASRQLGGKVRLQIRDLKGRATESGTLTASGTLLVTEGQLLGVPGIVKFLDPSSFGTDSTFSGLTATFDMKNRRFDIASFAMMGQKGQGGIYGQGWLDFEGKFKLKVNTETASILGMDFFLTNLLGKIFDIAKAAFKFTYEGNLDESSLVK